MQPQRVLLILPIIAHLFFSSDNLYEAFLSSSELVQLLELRLWSQHTLLYEVT
jgi:hypothetical protein